MAGPARKSPAKRPVLAWIARVSDQLPRHVRVGYCPGSVATGTFGTVPGLMLLPYLSDTLGVAAAVAGLTRGCRSCARVPRGA